MDKHAELMCSALDKLDKLAYSTAGDTFYDYTAPTAAGITGAGITGVIANKIGKGLPKKYRAALVLAGMLGGGIAGNRIGHNFADKEWTAQAARERNRLIHMAQLNAEKSQLDRQAMGNYSAAGLLPPGY